MVDQNTLLAWRDEASVEGYEKLFVIGIAAERITIYSQQVRALRLIHSLSELGDLDEVNTCAVIGGGVAGCTAACAVSALGINTYLFEKFDQLIERNGGNRPLDPHLYDWPMPDSLRADAGLPFLDWTSGTSSQRANEIRQKTHTFDANKNELNILLKHDVHKIEWDNTAWKVVHTQPGDIAKSETKRCQIVIIATGFGDEKDIPGAGTASYWDNNRPTAAPGKRVVISGNGDGGLLDMVLAATGEQDQGALMREFLDYLTLPSDLNGSNPLKSAIVAIEESFDEDPTSDFSALLEEHLKGLMEERGVFALLKNKINQRNLSIVFNVRKNLETGNKVVLGANSALISRLLAYAAIIAASQDGLGGVDVRHEEIQSFDRENEIVIVESGNNFTDVSNCVSRHGPAKKQEAAWFDDIYIAYDAGWRTWKQDQNNVIHLVPKLHPSTYDFYHGCLNGSDNLREWHYGLPAMTATLLLDEVSGCVLWRGIMKPEEFVRGSQGQDLASIFVTAISPQNCPPNWKGLIYRIAESDNTHINISINALDPDWRHINSQIVSCLADRMSKYVSEEEDQDGLNGHAPAATHVIDELFLQEVFKKFDSMADMDNPNLETPGMDVAIPDAIWDQAETTMQRWRHLLSAEQSIDLRRKFLSLMDGRFTDRSDEGPALSDSSISHALSTFFFAIAAEMAGGTLTPIGTTSVNARHELDASEPYEWFLCHSSRVNDKKVTDWDGTDPDSSAIVFVVPMSVDIALDQPEMTEPEMTIPGMGDPDPQFRIPLAGSQANWSAFEAGMLGDHLANLLSRRQEKLNELRGKV